MTIHDQLFHFAFKQGVNDATRSHNNISGIAVLIAKNTCIQRFVREYVDATWQGNAKRDAFTITVENIQIILKNHLRIDQISVYHIQSIINLTVKYLYLGCYTLPTLDQQFKAFHCPMNQQMIRVVLEDIRRVNRLLLTAEERKQLDFFLLRKTGIFLRLHYSKHSDTLQYDLFQKMVALVAKQQRLSPMAYYFMNQ